MDTSVVVIILRFHNQKLAGFFRTVKKNCSGFHFFQQVQTPFPKPHNQPPHARHLKVGTLLVSCQSIGFPFNCEKISWFFRACQRFFLIFCQYLSVADLFLRHPQPPLWHRARVSKSPLSNAFFSYFLK